MKTLFIAISLLVLSACHNQSQNQFQTKTGLTPVIGGDKVPEKDSLSYGIVGIWDTEEQAICTGSLIGPNIVLTAAHCINENPKKMKIIFNVNLDNIIGSKNQLLVNFYQRNVTDAKANSKYDPELNAEKEDDHGDIAVIKFEGALPEGYAPVEMLSDITQLKRDVEITVAGFGVSDVYTEPINAKHYKDLQDAIDYGEVYCYDEANTDCVKVDMGGDGILRQTHAPISSVQETEFRLDESKGHGTCSGDSGGPAYVTVDGKLLLTGVTSRGSFLCDNVGVYTDVVPYLSWINETIQLLK